MSPYGLGNNFNFKKFFILRDALPVSTAMCKSESGEQQKAILMLQKSLCRVIRRQPTTLVRK